MLSIIKVQTSLEPPPSSNSNRIYKSLVSHWESVVPIISIEFYGHHDQLPQKLQLIVQHYFFFIYDKNSFKRTKDKIHDISLHHYSICAIPLYASAIYKVCTRRYYTYKKTKCKTEKNYTLKNSLLLICTETIVTM